MYDPRDPNDRLLLGVKGTISEAELFTLRCRLHDGRWNKARRGELARSLPVGYVRSGIGCCDQGPRPTGPGEAVLHLSSVRPCKVARQVLRATGAGEAPGPREDLGWTASRPGHVEGAGSERRDPDCCTTRRTRGPTSMGRWSTTRLIARPTNGKAKVHPRPARRLAGVPARRLPGLHHVGAVREEPGDSSFQRVWLRKARGSSERPALLQGIAYCGRCGQPDDGTVLLDQGEAVSWLRMFL